MSKSRESFSQFLIDAYETGDFDEPRINQTGRGDEYSIEDVLDPRGHTSITYKMGDAAIGFALTPKGETVSVRSPDDELSAYHMPDGSTIVYQQDAAGILVRRIFSDGCVEIIDMRPHKRE